MHEPINVKFEKESLSRLEIERRFPGNPDDILTPQILSELPFPFVFRA